MKDWIFSRGLTYERLGDVGFKRVIEKAMELGAKYGRKGAVRFDFSSPGHNFITPNGCRLSLSTEYKSVIDF